MTNGGVYSIHVYLIQMKCDRLIIWDRPPPYDDAPTDQCMVEKHVNHPECGDHRHRANGVEIQSGIASSYRAVPFQLTRAGQAKGSAQKGPPSNSKGTRGDGRASSQRNSKSPRGQLNIRACPTPKRNGS